MKNHFTPLRSAALLACVLGITLGTTADVHADIYQYVDKSGVVHFSNNPKAKSGKFKLYLKTQDKQKKRSNVKAVLPSDKSLERFTRYDRWIRQAAILYQLPVELLRAVIMVESNYDPRATSSVGAQGLMQLMPETAQRMEVRDSYDPRENIFGGARYLRILANLFNGDLQLTVAAYNAGEGAVVKYNGVPPYHETQDYVVKVLTFYQRYRLQRDPVQASRSYLCEKKPPCKEWLFRLDLAGLENDYCNSRRAACAASLTMASTSFGSAQRF
jgi:hypothetical protein